MATEYWAARIIFVKEYEQIIAVKELQDLLDEVRNIKHGEDERSVITSVTIKRVRIVDVDKGE